MMLNFSIKEIYKFSKCISYITKELPRFLHALLYNILKQSRMYVLGKNKIMT